MTKRLAGVLALALGTAVFAGSAFAGNGHGNGNGRGNDAASAGAQPAQDSSTGNSANAPRQQKKDASSSAPSVPAVQPVAAASPDQVAPAGPGVKPSNTTAHDTDAAASSDQTKLYGNGKTAGQIAIKNGAAPNAILHGPGNSQPHKTAPCSGGHEIDVHALKGKGHQRRCGSPSSPPSSRSVPHSDPVPKGGSDPNVTPVPGNKPATHTTSRGQTPVPSRVGILSSSGVLGATHVVGRGTLPFTGFPLWIAVLLAAALIAVGLTLRRRFSS